MTWLALVGAFFVITNYTDLLPVDSILLTKKRYLLGFFGIVLLAQYVYAELYRAKLKYCIKSFRFVVSRGVFFPKLGSLPISIMAETYIRRNVIDILCGVCSFQIHTALDPTKSFLKIEGLKPESAIKLQALISEIISQQIWIPTEDFPEMKAKVSLDYLDNDRVIYDQQH